MNAQSQAVLNKQHREAPLFASPWMALFLLIRREWKAPRSRR